MKHADILQKKIIDRSQLSFKVNALKLMGKKIVFTNGCFDVLHRGHIDYLMQTADLADILIVGVNTNASVKRLKGEGRPINTEENRAFTLAALSFVDMVVLFDENTPLELINQIKPHVLTKGGDYTLDKIVGAKEVIENGGKVEIIPFTQGYSTTSLLEKIEKLG